MNKPKQNHSRYSTTIRKQLIISCLLEIYHYVIDKTRAIEVLTNNSRVKIINDISEIISELGCSQTNN